MGEGGLYSNVIVQLFNNERPTELAQLRDVLICLLKKKEKKAVITPFQHELLLPCILRLLKVDSRPR